MIGDRWREAGGAPMHAVDILITGGTPDRTNTNIAYAR